MEGKGGFFYHDSIERRAKTSLGGQDIILISFRLCSHLFLAWYCIIAMITILFLLYRLIFKSSNLYLYIMTQDAICNRNDLSNFWIVIAVIQVSKRIHHSGVDNIDDLWGVTRYHVRWGGIHTSSQYIRNIKRSQETHPPCSIQTTESQSSPIKEDNF